MPILITPERGRLGDFFRVFPSGNGQRLFAPPLAVYVRGVALGFLTFFTLLFSLAFVLRAAGSCSCISSHESEQQALLCPPGLRACDKTGCR